MTAALLQDDIELAFRQCDCMSEINEQLHDLREVAIAERDWKTIRALRIVRRRPHVKIELMEKVQIASAATVVGDNLVSDLGDGPLLQIILASFQNGGAEKLLEFILTILKVLI